MKIGISLKILQNAIEQQRLFAGKKGSYLDATVFIDISPADQYGNHGMITQDVTQAERDQKIKGPILGNAKIIWCDDPSVVYAGNAAAPQTAPTPMAAPIPPQAPAPMSAPTPQAPSPAPSPVKTDQQILVEFQQIHADDQNGRNALWATLTPQQQATLQASLT